MAPQSKPSFARVIRVHSFNRPAWDDFTLALRRWEPPESESAEALGEQFSFFDHGLEEDADPRHVIYEVIILKLRYSLNATIALLDVESSRVYRVSDVGRIDNPTHICLDDDLQDATIDALPLDKETTFVWLDTALDDSQKVNSSMQCLLKVVYGRNGIPATRAKMNDYRPFYQRHLPHWQPPGATLFVTLRLAGSLPQTVIDELQATDRQCEAALSRIEDRAERQKEADLETQRAFGRWDAALERARNGHR